MSTNVSGDADPHPSDPHGRDLRDQSPHAEAPRKKDRTHYLYIAVIAAVILGVVFGLVAPNAAQAWKPVGDGFVSLIKMIIAPVIFCTIVRRTDGARIRRAPRPIRSATRPPCRDRSGRQRDAGALLASIVDP